VNPFAPIQTEREIDGFFASRQSLSPLLPSNENESKSGQGKKISLAISSILHRAVSSLSPTRVALPEVAIAHGQFK